MASSTDKVRWLKPGVFSLSNRVSVAMFGLINVFLLVRLVPPSEIGIWVLFTSVASILETLRNGFIRNPFISRLVVCKIDERDGIIQSSFYLHVVVAIVMVLFLLIGASPLAKFWYADELQGLFYIYAVNTLLLTAFLHFEYLLQSKLEFKGIFFSTFSRQLIFVVFLAIYYVFNWELSLYILAIVQAVSILFASFVSYQFVKLNFPSFILVRPNLSVIRDLFHFGKYTFGTNISSMIIKNTDSWMIGRLISTAGVALYNPAIRISNIVEVPTLAIASVVFPQVGNKMKESGNEGIQFIYYKSVSLILAIMLPFVLPLYFFADIVILILFGEAYMEAVPILKVTIFYTLIVPFNRQFGTVLDALNMPKLNFYLLLAVALLNGILNYFFLSYFGVLGAAYATVLSYLIVFIANQFILFTKFQINTAMVLVELVNWYKAGWAYLRMRIVNWYDA